MLLLPSSLALLTLGLASVVSAEPQAIHLPLKPVARRTDIHPEILYQQHVNRALNRLAQGNGLQGIHPNVARANIDRRVVKINAEMTYTGRDVDMSALKRSTGHGMVNPNAPQTYDGKDVDIAGLKRETTASAGTNKWLETRRKKKGTKAGAAAAAAGGAGVAAAGAGGAAAAATAANGTAAAATGAAASNAAGFSKAELAAALSGDITKANKPTAVDSLAYDIQANDVGYLATIQMGTPPQDFLMLIDSGSADTWVPSQACTACGNHQVLGTKTSSTFKASNSPFQVTYGSGSVAGMIVQDVVSIAGNSVTQSLGVALQESVEFSGAGTQFDGLVGVAKSTLSNQKVPTPIEALASAGVVPGAIMSYDMGRVADGVNNGQVSFGAIDTARVDAATSVTVPVVSAIGFWEAAVDATSVDGKDLGLSGKTAILDTGTTLVIMPPADAAAIHAAIPGSASDGQGGFTIPCTTTAKLAMTFGGQAFDVDPRDLTFVPVDQNDLAGLCISGISSGQIGGANQWLVGDVFLKNVIFSTDVGANTISLAKKASAAGGAAAAAAPAAAAPAATPATNAAAADQDAATIVPDVADKVVARLLQTV